MRTRTLWILSLTLCAALGTDSPAPATVHVPNQPILKTSAPGKARAAKRKRPRKPKRGRVGVLGGPAPAPARR